MGIKAGTPYFQLAEQFPNQKIAGFSSNYELYGELTGRVVEIIKKEDPAYFRYSIDECFVYLDDMEKIDLKAWGEELHKKIKQLELFEDEEDFGKYRYSCFVTDLDLPAKIVYDSYRGRADSENRIKELKNDFSIDDFVTNNFWATEACGNFIVMAYNFMSLFRHALINSNKKKFLKTIRYELISIPAYLGRTKDKHILYLARSLKTRQAFLSIWEKLKDFSLPYDTEKS